jgi:deoxyadenosine/deoxycytidine kinase
MNSPVPCGTPTPILISIDGGVGSGKSTLLDQLRREYTDWHFIDEPLDTWTSLQNESGENLLEVFYKDKRRWSYTLQNCAVLSRYLNIRRAIEDWQRECARNPAVALKNVFVTERCLETDFNVFAQMLRDDGCLDGIEWELYKQWYRMLQDTTRVTGIVYVNTSPEVCASRITKRGRKGEEEIPLNYLQALDKYHKRWIDHMASPVMLYNNYIGDAVGHNRPEDVARFVSRLR